MKHERKSGFLVANIAPTLCKVQFYPFVMTGTATGSKNEQICHCVLLTDLGLGQDPSQPVGS